MNVNVEIDSSTIIEKVLSKRKLELGSRINRGIPKYGSLANDAPCHNLSKAFEISKTPTTDSPYHSHVVQSPSNYLYKRDHQSSKPCGTHTGNQSGAYTIQNASKSEFRMDFNSYKIKTITTAGVSHLFVLLSLAGLTFLYLAQLSQPRGDNHLTKLHLVYIIYNVFFLVFNSLVNCKSQQIIIRCTSTRSSPTLGQEHQPWSLTMY